MRTKKNFIKRRNLGLFISYAELRKYRKSTFSLYPFSLTYDFMKIWHKTVRLKWNKERYFDVVGGDLC